MRYGWAGDGGKTEVEEDKVYEVAIEVKFDAAHRLPSYEGKCRFLHGHTFSAVVCVARKELEGTGFVIDFSYLKKFVKEWIDENWDHATILSKDDALALTLTELSHDELTTVLEPQGGLNETEIAMVKLLCSRLKGHRVFVMQSDPTAERMAKLLFDIMKAACPDEILQVFGIATTRGYPTKMRYEKIDNPITVQYVSIRETPTSVATYREE